MTEISKKELRKLKKLILSKFRKNKNLKLSIDILLEDETIAEYGSEAIKTVLNSLTDEGLLVKQNDGYRLNLINHINKKTKLKYSPELGYYVTEKKITKTKILIKDVPANISIGDEVEVKIVAETPDFFYGEIVSLVKKQGMPSLKKLKKIVKNSFDEENPRKTVSLKHLVKKVVAETGNIAPADLMLPVVKNIVNKLTEGNQIVEVAPEEYQLSLKGKTFPATITKIGKTQTTTLIDKYNYKVFIEKFPKNIKPNDKVTVKITKQTKKRLEGEIQKAQEQTSDFTQDFFSGIVVEKRNGKAIIKPSKKEIKRRFSRLSVSLPNFKISVDDRVLLKPVKTYISKGKLYLKAEIVSKIEYDDIIKEFGLPERFPDKVLKELEQIPKELPEDEIRKRIDFRDVLTFTIDPEDAKDFDDALSIREIEPNIYEIGVHIADVSYYVPKGSATDWEARKRGTSVYLPGGVIPMLPELLSNDLCSLKPNVERFAFSAIFHISSEGEVLKESFAKTIIRSDKRFTYKEAQDILDDKIPSKQFKEPLKILNKIAKKLREKRFIEGSVKLLSDEIKIILDENGNIIEVRPKELYETNELIEDFMLLANRKVAKFIDKKIKKTEQVPASMYRIHDAPRHEKLVEFNKMIKALGIDENILKYHNEILGKKINEILARLSEENPDKADLIAQVAVRTMSKAVYSTDNIGHFGLGFEYYTHFTSPIRRYPDLVIHRILEAILNNKKLPYTYAELTEIAEHASYREEIAVQAEREAVKLKLVEYLKQFIGEEFPAMITGFSQRGLFVKIVENGAEGLLKYSEFDEPVMPEPEKFRIILKFSKEILTLGDIIYVVIKDVNLKKREIDFTLPHDEPPAQYEQ